MSSKGVLVRHSTDKNEGRPCDWNDIWRCFYERANGPMCMICLSSKVSQAYFTLWSLNPLTPLQACQPAEWSRLLNNDSTEIMNKMVKQVFPDEYAIMLERSRDWAPKQPEGAQAV